MINFNYIPTVIGSFPHLNPKEISRVILDLLPEVPVWPQLPKLGFKEEMYVQFAERIPCLKIEEKEGRIYFETEKESSEEIEEFYSHFLAEDIDWFSISPEFAQGLYAFFECLSQGLPSGLRFLKGQVTGPFSFGLTVTDEKRRPILYHSLLFDCVVKACGMKARWQIRMLKRFHPKVIIFIDEPYLASVGSGFISLKQEDILKMLNEVIEMIHEEGSLCGIHCCGNTDFGLVMQTKTDILSFDAYNYFEGFSLYTKELNQFLDRGGNLAWGIIPSSTKIQKETYQSLGLKFKGQKEIIKNKGGNISLLNQRILITPSCGLGTLSLSLSQEILKFLPTFVSLLKNKKRPLG
jgi:hypothetical protein